VIVAGFGFSSKATTGSLADALRIAHAGLPPVTVLATLADKAAALEDLAETRGLGIIAVSGPLPDTPTQSGPSLRARGTGSVAEACALAVAGEGGYLRRTRVVSGDGLATCAIAQGGCE